MDNVNKHGHSEHTQKLLLENSLYPRYKKTEKKYIKRQVVLNTDYNILENQYVIRKFFQAKFNLPLRELELLLYLFPKQYFSHRDYKDYPLSFTHRKISSVIKKGYVIVFRKGKNQDKHIYTLSKSAKHLIQVYYKYLGGELLIPICAENNPMIRNNATPHQQKIISMFKKMRERVKQEEQEQGEEQTE
jgi:hypothetical protein